MNTNNTQRLIEACPSLYGDNFYFECGDGWFLILLDASISIQKILDKYPKSIRNDIVATRVKEKYGTLRFDLSYYMEDLDEIINDLEKKSCHTCEVCGAQGKLRGTSWLYTACDEHTNIYDSTPDKSVAK